jgi:Ca-activated chloride channel homolog
MPDIKPQISLHTERPVVRKDISTTFDIVVEINSSTDTQNVSFESKPCNLCLVIDRSGSMQGEKLDIAKQACLDIYQRLDFQKDRLSVVVFDDTAEVIFNPDIPHEQFEEKIQNIRSGGSTDLASGWRLGLLEIQTHGSEEHINRVILLSDGHANRGETKKDVLARDSEQAYNLGITTSTIGIGKDFEEDILDAIATASCGNFWFVEEISLETIIKTEFEGALSIS